MKRKIKKRNMVVVNMISRSQKAGYHPDKKKHESRRKCRSKITEE